VGEVIARTAVKPHLRASLAGNDAEAVMFDFMQPLAAGRQLIGFGREARRMRLLPRQWFKALTRSK
jgi:hypothetical protein